MNVQFSSLGPFNMESTIEDNVRFTSSKFLEAHFKYTQTGRNEEHMERMPISEQYEFHIFLKIYFSQRRN